LTTPNRDEPPRPTLLGWQERLDLPEWKLRRIRVKIDTGARTSALDAVGYELFEEDGKLMARLRLALSHKHPDRLKVVQTPVLKLVVVSNSGGIREQRPLVETMIRLGPVTKRIRLTITNRASMRFRMLLGREALCDDFLVDPSKKNLLRL
jgi:hypothetical protein